MPDIALLTSSYENPSSTRSMHRKYEDWADTFAGHVFAPFELLRKNEEPDPEIYQIVSEAVSPGSRNLSEVSDFPR